MPAIIYFLIIFYLSSISSPPVPSSLSDDILHIIEFFLLFILIYRAFNNGLFAKMEIKNFIYSLIFPLFYSGLDEYHQSFVPGRDSSLKDVRNDIIGIFLAAIAIIIINKIMKEKMTMIIEKIKNLIMILLILLIPIFGYSEIMPIDQIKIGMKGIGKTALENNNVVEFNVEIIAVLKNVFPKKNLILARLDDKKLKEAGVIAGMSGSPIYIDGKIIGAVAYSWPFSKEAIAGITPIEDMIGMPQKAIVDKSNNIALAKNLLEFIFNPQKKMQAEEYYREFLSYFPINNKNEDGIFIRGVPLIINSLTKSLYPILENWWQENGFIPIIGGNSIQTNKMQELKEGDAIAVSFIKGDIDISAIGTVSYIDQNKIFAFGHPLFNLGNISFPMAKAEIQTIVPNLLSSFKVGNTGETIGTFKQDFSSAIFGILGEKPPLIPFKINTSFNKQNRAFNFYLADHNLLSPILANYVINEAFAATESNLYEGTWDITGVIDIEGHQNVIIDNIYSGFLSMPEASTFVSSIFGYLLNNEFEKVKIKNIELNAAISDEQKIADLIEVNSNKLEVKKGEKVNFTIAIKPFQKESEMYNYILEIPMHLQPGKYFILFGSAEEFNRFDYFYYYKLTSIDSLNQVIRLINNIKRNDRIYVRIFRSSPSLIVKSKIMSDLPPTFFDIIDSPRAAGGANKVFMENLWEDAIQTNYVIKGLKRVMIEVKN